MRIHHVGNKEKRLRDETPSLADQVAALMEGGEALEEMRERVKHAKLKFQEIAAPGRRRG